VPPLLSIQDLRVDFPDVIAVNGLSMELEAGDVYALIGPNGAGKTTTMRAIAGLQECTRGEIYICGQPISRNPRDTNQLFGFMPDFSPVYDKLTVMEFLDHFARAYDLPDRGKRISECIELTWLTEKRNALCDGLSRGMKQRLTLAKTLLHDPKLLLLDEPASGLDPLGRIELRKLLLQLRSMGKAILVSSHILTELAEFCNNVGIMERGQLILSGPIGELANVKGSRSMLLSWRTSDHDVESLLKNLAGVSNLRIEAHRASFDFAGDDEALDQILPSLVRAGVRVTEWRERVQNLEQIFLESGARSVM